MTIHENLRQFAGKPVVDFKKAGDVSDFASVSPRLRCEYDETETLVDFLAIMLEQPGVAAAQALVLGLWMQNGESFEVTPQPAIEMLVSMRERLPNLKALFVGDIVSEENEISWIGQSDHSALWGAFPELEYFGARGGNGLRLGRINHQKLETLVIEAGGLPSIVVSEALEANAPLRHLELWLGDENYGANTSVEDFKDLFAGNLFPQLRTLGLCNCQYTDAIAEALATAPILDRIDALDLSKGTLGDDGARALLNSGKLTRLKRFDITHHYVSQAMLVELRRATPLLVADEPQTPDDWDGEAHRYIAVSE